MQRSKSRQNYLALACASFLAYAPFTASAQTAPPQAEATGPQAAEGIVAVVNDEIITYSDVRERARFILVSLGVAPNANTIRQAQTRAIDGLIDEKLQIQEAFEKFELVIEDEEVEESVENLAANSNTSKDLFLAGLVESGLNPRTLRDQIRADITWRRLVGGRFGSKVRISELQINDSLERLSKSLQEPQYRISEIFLPGITQEEIQQVFEGAWELKRQIEAGAAPFDAVARQFSAAPTASAGGEIGWIGESQLKSTYADQVRALEKPGVTEPIVVDNGVYLISLVNKQAPVEETLKSFDLKQIFASGSDAANRVQAAANSIDSCDGLDLESASDANVEFADIGETLLPELSTTYVEAFNAIADGDKTQLLNLGADKAAIVYVCSKNLTRGDMPTREEIEDKLHGEMVDMMANRYLRDLRRDATIIRR